MAESAAGMKGSHDPARDLREESGPSAALLAFALNSAKTVVLLVDEHGKLVYVNDEACRVLGYTRDELLRLPFADLDPDFPIETWPAPLREVQEKGAKVFDSRHRTRDGRILPVELSVNYFEYQGQGYVLGLAHDITERKRTEELLQTNERRYRLAEAIGHVGNWEYDFQTTQFWGSDEARRIYGFDPEQPSFSAGEVESCIPERERVHQALVDLIEANKPYDLEFEIHPRDSSEPKIITSTAELQRDEHGNPLRVIGMIQDVTRRKRMEEKLRERESFIRRILDSVDEGFIVVDREYRIISANRAFCAAAGLPEEGVVGRKCHQVGHDLSGPCSDTGVDCAVRRTFETGTPQAASHVHVDKNGAKRKVELRSYPITDAKGAVVSAIETTVDVTERTRLEDQLRHAQKMEAIGTLAGGVAHDFNNVLTAIIGYAIMLQGELEPEDPLRDAADQILAASNKAAQLTRALLAFSRKQIINPKRIDLSEVVRNVDKLLRRLIGEDIELSMKLAKSVLAVMADAGQIEQVLLNLVTNARDAMPEGGRLSIVTEAVELAEDPDDARRCNKPAWYARLFVSDTGAGIDEASRQKVFEPFFTTKEFGKGTGLGLAIVYGIVKQHGGAIKVHSELGKGTTFEILFPIVEGDVVQERPQPTALPARGTETVLLAEDDRIVRGMASAALRSHGYEVIEAVDGDDALEKFAAHDAEVDLLILDVVMPKKSGREVYEAIRARWPDVRVLFLSGYTAEIIHQKGILDEGLQFMAKPFGPFDLLGRIRGILDQGR